MMYGSECWALNKKKKFNMENVDTRRLRWMCDVAKLDRIRITYVYGKV